MVKNDLLFGRFGGPNIVEAKMSIAECSFEAAKEAADTAEVSGPTLSGMAVSLPPQNHGSGK